MATSKVSGKPSRRSVIKHTMDHPKLNDQTSLGISVKWLIQIIIVAAMVVWGYFGLTSKISHLETDVLRMKDSVTMNSEFRVKWPLGQLGALPDDAEQNMRLRFIEKDMEVIEAHVDTLRIKSVQQQELHNPPHPFLPAAGYPKETETGGTR